MYDILVERGSWVDQNKNQNLHLDLGHLIGSLRRKKKLRAWSEDSKRLDVVVFENKEEERYDHDDLKRGWKNCIQMLQHLSYPCYGKTSIETERRRRSRRPEFSLEANRTALNCSTQFSVL